MTERDEIVAAVKAVAIRLHNQSAEAPIGSRERRDLVMKAAGAFEALSAVDKAYKPIAETVAPLATPLPGKGR